MQSWIDSAIMALATKIEIEDGVESKVEDVIKNIVSKALEDSDFL